MNLLFYPTDSSMPTMHFLDLNAPPGTIIDTALRKSTSQFEPVTPEKINRGEYQQECSMKHSSIAEAPPGEKNEMTRHVEMMQHDQEKRSHLIGDQLCEVMSTQLQENHKPDKGGTEGTDLVNTPQQKARRKKHRPKVIIEGQKKNTPKSSAQKINAPQGTTRVKRKYVRKNAVTSPLSGGTNGTGLDIKTPSSTDTPVGKRKYRRTRRISKSENIDKKPQKCRLHCVLEGLAEDL